MLEVQDVRKSYGEVRAVDGLSFSTGPGQIFGLIGPNGAGKSTTIRMVMNIIAPDSGRILLDGNPLGESDKARIGYLPEERGLYRKSKVEDILVYLASLKGLSEAEGRRRLGPWLERFDLQDWRTRKIEELSKGMAQKAQFIGTVLHSPDLLLFDEPFSGLDPLSQDELLAALLELKARGATVLFSTHVMEHAERICDSILLVDHGKALLSGKLEEIKAREGRNAVQLEFDGDASFVADLACVARLTAYPHWAEAELRPGTDPDELYRELAGRLRMRRFETLSPSLHSIFVRIVGTRSQDLAAGETGGRP